VDKIIQYIKTVEETLKSQTYNKAPQELYNPIEYTLKVGGKRIRPALLLLANDLFGGQTKNAIDAAIAIEIFHNFTLVHDDIMDNAPLRRGKPTVCKKWNKDIAILSGDVMLVEAYQSLIKCNPVYLVEILAVFNESAIKVCEGQQFDMNFENSSSVNIDDYLKMIELKTAVLLGTSLKIGTILSGADSEDAMNMYEYGKNLGVAFQLMDDILDLYGNPKKFGKRIGGDIIANKKTYLLLKAQEIAKGSIRKELEFCLSSNVLEEELKVGKIKRIFNELNIKQLANNEMKLFFNTAISHLDSVKAPSNKKVVFENFAKSLMNREY